MMREEEEGEREKEGERLREIEGRRAKNPVQTHVLSKELFRIQWAILLAYSTEHTSHGLTVAETLSQSVMKLETPCPIREPAALQMRERT